MYYFYRFRLLIVGGGPAGTAIIIRAMRLGCLSEMCGSLGNSAGICVVEKGPVSRFGGGKLLDYEVCCYYCLFDFYIIFPVFQSECSVVYLFQLTIWQHISD